MKKYNLFLLLSLMAIACSSFEKEKLYGHWKNETWEMVFNEDGSCRIGKGGNFLKGELSYHSFGNALEIVNNGKVFLSNLTVKSIENDQLTLEFRKVFGNSDGQTDDIQILKRVE
jgi:hypothetical protein